jgi:hypothetical protein
MGRYINAALFGFWAHMAITAEDGPQLALAGVGIVLAVAAFFREVPA